MMKIIEDINKKEWSKFVYDHNHGNIFQMPEMAEVYKRTKRFEPIKLAVVDDSNNGILAFLLAVVIHEMSGIFGSCSARSIIQGGPLYIEDDEGIKALKILIEYYNEIARKKAIYTEIRNVFCTKNTSNLFNGVGYRYEGHLNFLVDLTKSREELWSNLSKKRRNGIRKAMKRGVIIELMENKGHIAQCYDLIQETYKNAKLPHVDISLFESTFNVLVPPNRAKFFLAKHEDKSIGVILALVHNRVVYDWFAGASREHLNLCPNDILAWHVMEWGAKNGYHTFDFGGAGKPNEAYGVRDFKRQFGGELVNYGRYENIHSPIRMKIAKKGFNLYKKLL